MSKEIGRRIRELRQSYNMTIEQLSELLDITPGFLNSNEKGVRGMKIDKLVKTCEIFHVSMDYLIFGHRENLWIDKNEASIFESILNEDELRMLVNFAKKLSLKNYASEEIDMLAVALNFQLTMITSIKGVYNEHSDMLHKSNHMIIK